jgi:hypothetical protein
MGEILGQEGGKLWDLQPVQNQLNIADFCPWINDCKSQNWLAVVG